MSSLIIFDINTNYLQVEATVKQLYSNLIATSCGCKCQTSIEISKISTLILAIDIDKLSNISRWEHNLKTAYKLLKLNCGCK